MEAILVDEKGDVPLNSFSAHGSHNIPETAVSQATRGIDDGIANSNRDWRNLNQATEMPTTSNVNIEKPSYVKESLKDLQRELDESDEKNNGNSRICLPKDDNPVSYSVRAPLKDNHYLRYTQKSQKRVAYHACNLLNENGATDIRYPYSTNEENAAETLRQARRLDFFITRRSYSWKEPSKSRPTESDRDLKEINLKTERVNCPNTNTNRKANVVDTKVQPMPSTQEMETKLDAKDVVPDRKGVELLQQNFTSTGATKRTDCDVAKNDQRVDVPDNKTDKSASSSVHPGNPSISRNKSSCISSQNRRVTSDKELENRHCQKEVPFSGITNKLQTGVDIANEKPAITSDSKEHSNLSTVKASTKDGLQVSRRSSVTVSDCSAQKDDIPSCADLDKTSGKSDVVANGKNVKTEQEIGARKGIRLQKVDNLKEHQDETQPLTGKAAVPKDQRFQLVRNVDKKARADVKETDVPKRGSFVQNVGKDICQNEQTCSATAQTGTDQPSEDPVTQGINPPRSACLPSQADGSCTIAQSSIEPTAVVEDEKESGTLVTDDSLAVASSSTVQQCQPEDQMAVSVATLQPLRCESADAMDINEKDEAKTVQNARDDDDGIVVTLQPQEVNHELQPQSEKQAKRRRRGKGARALDEILAANRAREEDERKAAELLKQNEYVPLTAEQKEEKNKDCHRNNPGCANGNAQEDKGIDTADAENRANEQKERREKVNGIRKCAANFVKNGSTRKILKAKRVVTLSKVSWGDLKLSKMYTLLNILLSHYRRSYIIPVQSYPDCTNRNI